ncbi:hypothetical protein L0B53_17460 [Vibrio sp. SS-MA-C1-2]|uniref:hypothetical protein n=1 Tax=Vibrio sp. SS-MA-C1-2 TaxID=2908646 RepID=UPI001F1A03AF|nr:hypothetical protein [Vibrio sp. SS-MA-C1-2]UJF18755.1 hypothetical protein L0B53_17460 [Vibrio sp. SS-MA-C1-2]
MDKLSSIVKILLLVLISSYSLSTFANTETNSAPTAKQWPQQIEVGNNSLVVYEPQAQELTGNVLQGRTAVSFKVDGGEPIFGTMWFTTRVDIDKSEDKATARNFVVTKMGWPKDSEVDSVAFTKRVNDTIENSVFIFSASKLAASLKIADRENSHIAELKNTPPKMVFSNQLALLLLFDGEPKFKVIPNSDYLRAENTPYYVVKSTKTSQYYLTDGVNWYFSRNVMSGWMPESTPPSDLIQLVSKQMPADQKKRQNQFAHNLKIIVATEPTEVISTDGVPNWQALSTGNILYVKNTETAWLRDLSSGEMYVLLSGRWFKSTSKNGPWVFVPATELPKAFKDIPANSEIGGVRTSVAGTPEADQAVMDAQIPQTTAIDRSKATLTVAYSGQPQFVVIPGTNIYYVQNSGTQVLRIDNRYYALDNAVWFTSTSASGPWVVADTIPTTVIAEIPPSSPAYNMTFVQIYDSTPTVVYVGYTPGYLWSFPYYGVPVYGTGWYYPPYVGAIYYPRPVTWGLHVGYNSWTGWNVGVSWSNGFISAGFGWSQNCCGHWGWGGNNIHDNNINIENNGNINIGNTVNIGNRTDVNKHFNNINGNNVNRNDINRNNIYQNRDNRLRNANVNQLRDNHPKARVNNQLRNNVYADKNGNIMRNENGQWQQRTNNSWKTRDLNQLDTNRVNQQQRHNRQLDNHQNLNNNHKFQGNNQWQHHSTIDREGLNHSFQNRQFQGQFQGLGGMRAGGGLHSGGFEGRLR